MVQFLNQLLLSRKQELWDNLAFTGAAKFALILPAGESLVRSFGGKQAVLLNRLFSRVTELMGLVWQPSTTEHFTTTSLIASRDLHGSFFSPALLLTTRGGAVGCGTGCEVHYGSLLRQGLPVRRPRVKSR